MLAEVAVGGNTVFIGVQPASAALEWAYSQLRTLASLPFRTCHSIRIGEWEVGVGAERYL